MVYSFGTARQKKIEPPANILQHQERVNLEVFKAIELLGRKLERVEGERDRLGRRLALIESSAEVDEKTGKLYLPAVIDPASLPKMPVPSSAPKWMAAASLMSSAIALFALGVVLFREPQSVLTPEQTAALTALTAPRLAQIDENAWRHPAIEESADATPPALPPQQVATPPPAPVAVTSAPEVKTAAVVPPAAPVAVPAPAPAHEDISAADKVLPPAAVADTTAPVKLAPEAPKAVAKAETAPAKTEKAAADTPAPDAALPAKLAQMERRALDGVPEAQHDLGTLYASGKVVPQDYKRAVYWFAKAADGGVANAGYNLGVMYQQGLGVKQDLTKALAWYKVAADKGHPEAMYNLGIAYIEGVGTEKNIDKAVSYFQGAANAGVAQAAFNLGVLYESNFIGKIDLAKALEWYQVAANEGHADAQAAVTRLKTKLGKNVADNSNDQALKLNDMVEPASGETGEGDASPADENTKPSPQNDLIAKIQSALIHQGLLPQDSVTGTADSRTQDAIRSWQTKAGVTPDGLPSQELLDKMSAPQKN